MKEPRKRDARPPGPITADYLFRAAVHYLERYASSSANLERVLKRKVARRAAARGEDAAQFRHSIEAALARIAELGLIDDAAFAEAKLRSLRRRGASERMAAGKLAQKGVARPLVEATMAADETSEAEAAFAYARRRRLGPFRSRDREAKRDRDLAAMVRAGFSFSQAQEIVDGDGEGTKP